MKNKIFIFLITWVLIISLWLMSRFINNSKNNISNQSGTGIINNTSDQSGTGITNVIPSKITKDQLIWECENILNSKESKILEWKNIVTSYIVIKNTNFDNSNTYLDFSNLKKWNCDYFKWVNNRNCLLIKNKNIEELDEKIKKWTYENILLKSFAWEQNICNNLIDILENTECNMYYDDYMNIDKDVDNLIWWSSFDSSKAYVLLWKDEFYKKLNDEFLNKCINLEGI